MDSPARHTNTKHFFSNTILAIGQYLCASLLFTLRVGTEQMEPLHHTVVHCYSAYIMTAQLVKI